MLARYCLQCGARLTERQMDGRVRPVCPLCSYVHYVNPVVAAGTLVEQDDSVLLIRRAVEPALGSWGLPAGYAEVGETPEQAAQRETREETGLEIETGDLLGIYAFSDQSPTSGVLVVYTGRRTGGHLYAGDDALDARFFPADGLPADIAFRTHRQVLNEWARARRLSYRVATAKEVKRCRQLALDQGLAQPPSWEHLFLDDRATLLIAFDESEIVGWLLLNQPTHDEMRVETIHVREPFRRWGIATRLLRHGHHIARQRAATTISAHVPSDSQALIFFLQTGYIPCGVVETGPGFMLCLEYRLADD